MTRPATLLKPGRHFLFSSQECLGPTMEKGEGKCGPGAFPPPLLSGQEVVAAKQCICRRQQRAERCICGRLVQGQGSSRQIEWEGDNLFSRSGRAGFHRCVFVPEQAQLPKTLTPPHTPQLGDLGCCLLRKRPCSLASWFPEQQASSCSTPPVCLSPSIPIPSSSLTLDSFSFSDS